MNIFLISKYFCLCIYFLKCKKKSFKKAEKYYKMFPLRSIIYRVIIFSILVLFYCEFFIYYIVQFQCSWPILETNETENSVKALIIADTHLLGSKKGHWFDKLRREWQMYRAFQTAINLHKPELVFVLGDLLDEGSFCSDEEFNYYIKRFFSLFKVPESTIMHIVVGNHDIGFHYRIHPHLLRRFEEGFNSPGIQLIQLKGNNFVLINSMALEGDGCSFCIQAEMELVKIQKFLQCSLEVSKNNKQCKSRPILMQHYPLYRDSDKECTDFDSVPLPEKDRVFKEKWDCLSKEATYQLIKQINPRLVLSGHTHHGCTRKLPIGNGTEITIPSFSWRNKNNPNYALMQFSSDKYASVKCEIPKESTVINVYIISFFGLILLLIWSIRRVAKSYQRKIS